MNVSKSELKNPYTEKITGGRLVTVQGTIGEEDHKFIRRVSDNSGALRAIIGITWQKLVIVLKEHGITDYTQTERFIDFVNNMQLVDARTARVDKEGRLIVYIGPNGGTVGGVDTQTAGPNDHGGTPGVCSAPEGVTNVGAVVEGSGGSQQTSKKGKRKS